MTAQLTVGVLAYPGCFASEVFGVLDLLTMGNRVAEAHRQEPAFDTVVMSPRPSVTASGGVPVGTRPVRDVDVLVVPGFDLSPGLPVADRLHDLRPELALLRERVAAGRPVVSICVGAFLLGAAGALDDREVTTAWLFADDLAARHPAATVRSDRLVVTDGGVTTTAAFSAMFDFVLDLVERHHGPRVARSTARIALLDDTRTSQAPYVEHRLLPHAGTGLVRDVQRHLERHLDRRYDLDALATHFHLSTRSLLRHFKTATGETPLTYLQHARVRHAQHLLETTGQPLADVRRAVGYADSSAFTRLFERETGLRPADYRARFANQTRDSRSVT